MGMVSAGPYLFHVAIDWYIVPGLAQSITTKKAVTGLFWTVFAYTASLLLSFGVQFVQVRIMQWVGQETMYDLRKEIFEHLQRLPMSFFDRTPVGRLVTRATTDVDALNDLFATGVVAMLNDFVLLFGLAIFLLSWHFYLGLAALSPLPFMVLLTYFFRNHVRDANRRIRTAIARINGFLQEHISGMSVVQLFNRERKSARAVRRPSTAFTWKRTRTRSTHSPISFRVLNSSAWAALPWSTGWAACAPSPALSKSVCSSPSCSPRNSSSARFRI